MGVRLISDARARLGFEHSPPDGMRQRLAETHSLLLAPGSGEIEELLAARSASAGGDPVRGARRSRGWTASTRGRTGSLSRTRATLCLVLVQPRGSAFASGAAEAFIEDVDSALAPVRDAHPRVSFALTGGHAIAWATESMLRRDFALSGTLSIALASLVFLLAFRRARALLAGAPPLVVGTLWTTGIAAFWPGGISAVAVAFMAVVVGVGVDTGVHVYAALARSASARAHRPSMRQMPPGARRGDRR